jgi:hypothetical protein
VALHAPHRCAFEQEYAEIDEVAAMMPQDVVVPAAPMVGGANVLKPVDEEAAGDEADTLLIGPGPRQQFAGRRQEAHRVAEHVDHAAPLARGHHALGTREAHLDRDLDQRVFAGFRAANRLRLMLVARRGQDEDVRLGVGQRVVERQGPAAIALARGELPARVGPASDRGIKDGSGIDEGRGVPVRVRHPFWVRVRPSLTALTRSFSTIGSEKFVGVRDRSW